MTTLVEVPAQTRCADFCDRVLIYARESTYEAKAGNRSPEEQIEYCVGWCATMRCSKCGSLGLDLVEVDGRVGIIDSGKGASRHSKSRGKRSGWDLTRKLLRDGDHIGPIKYLANWASNRATRDLEEYTALRKLCEGTGALWAYAGRVYDLNDDQDRFSTAIDVVVAEKDVGEIRRNVKRAIDKNASNGRPHGRKLFGYKRTYDPNSGALLSQEEDPRTAPLVRAAFDWYLAGIGCPTIARRFNLCGAVIAALTRTGVSPTTTTKGNLWTPGKVWMLLRNPGYAGRRVLRGEVIRDADWLPIVDPAVFDLVQARLDASSSPSKRSNGGGVVHRREAKAKFLSGTATCGVCGAALWSGGGTPRAKNKNGTTRTKLPSYRCVANSCVSVNAEALDRLLRVLIIERLQDVTTAERIGDAPATPDLAAARADIESLRERLEEAKAGFAAGQITLTTLSGVEADLLDRIEQAEKRVSRMVVPISVDVPPADRVEHWWDNELEPDQHRAIARALLVELTVHPTGRGRRFDRDRVSYEWREF